MNEFDLLMAELKALVERTILIIEKAEKEENILMMNWGLEVLTQAKMKLEEMNAAVKKEPGKIKRFLARVAAGMN
jgi:hypothetical protein